MNLKKASGEHDKACVEYCKACDEARKSGLL